MTGAPLSRGVASTADYQQIAELTSRMGILADERDWQRLGELFDETVALDNTSLRGGEPARLSREEVVAGWREALEGLDATQHLIANDQIEVEEGRRHLRRLFSSYPPTGRRTRRSAIHARWAL